EDADSRRPPFDLLGGLDPPAARHRDVQEDDVGAVLRRHLDRLLAGRRLAGDRHAGRLLEDPFEPLAEEGVVVGDQDLDHGTVSSPRARRASEALSAGALRKSARMPSTSSRLAMKRSRSLASNRDARSATMIARAASRLSAGPSGPPGVRAATSSATDPIRPHSGRFSPPMPCG